MTKYLLLILLISLTVYSCKKNNETISEGLTSDGFKFAKPNEKGELVVVNDAIFKKGESINLILLSIKGFKKGNDGLNLFEMSIEVTNSKDEIVLSQINVLGENGHILLPNDVADSPFGVFHSEQNMLGGNYRFKVIVHDLISNNKLTQISYFNLK